MFARFNMVKNGTLLKKNLLSAQEGIFSGYKQKRAKRVFLSGSESEFENKPPKQEKMRNYVFAPEEINFFWVLPKYDIGEFVKMIKVRI